jgi:hypothetical protein
MAVPTVSLFGAVALEAMTFLLYRKLGIEKLSTLMLAKK